MSAATFWVAFYWIVAPVALFAILFFWVQSLRQTYGEPQLEGRLTFHDDSVRAQSGSMIGSPPFRLWVTTEEIVLRLRPGYRDPYHTGMTTRIPAQNVSGVFRLPDGKIRLALKGGSGLHWDFTTERATDLLRVLQDVGGTPAP